MEPKPDAFLSYTRFDDKFASGAISTFRTQLAAHIQALTGKPFLIFQDVDGIGLGEHWSDKLDDMLNHTRFFIPILTPSFFESQPCRTELESFLKAETKAGRKDLILPIYWTESELLDEETLRSEDPLAVILHERHHHDWRPLVFEAFDSPDVQKSLQKLARDIRTAKGRTIHAISEQQKVAVGGDSRVLDRVVEPRVSATHLPPNTLLPSPGTIFRDIEMPWCPEMVVIPPGVFTMGSPMDEADREDNEGPQHLVEIEEPFALGRFPITRGEFAAFVKATGHEGKGAYVLRDDLWAHDRNAHWRWHDFDQTDQEPVVCVSHEDAMEYLDWLSAETGERYELPSEAMWEYASRAGSTTAFWTGETISTDKANYKGNSPFNQGNIGPVGEGTKKVDRFDPNPFGLFDMHGNTWEWCADRWHEDYRNAPNDGAAWLDGKDENRVVRGGSWFNWAGFLRSASRSAEGPNHRIITLGFRCARMQS